MHTPFQPMPSSSDAAWRTSSYCASNTCVQIGSLDGDWVGIRDSKIECSTILSYSRDEFRDFVKGVKAGEFDDLC